MLLRAVYPVVVEVGIFAGGSFYLAKTTSTSDVR